MRLDQLRNFIIKEIKEAKEYSEFLEVVVKPELTAIGMEHYAHLHFFNLGYQVAMEKIKCLLNVDDEVKAAADTVMQKYDGALEALK